MDNSNKSNSPNPASPLPPLPQNMPTDITSTWTPPVPTSSPLDNPWGAPAQSSPQPTWVPPTPEMSNANVVPDQTTPPPPPPTEPTSSGPAPELAPTDLSHLINNNPQPDNGQNVSPSAETLVVPPQNSSSIPEVPTIPTEGRKGIPVWIIGVGIALLIIVVSASAYFILGIGQPKTTTSLPAQIEKTTVKVPPPIPTPAPQPTAPAATGSANFGQLQGNSASPSATSAIEAAKQRQQQGL